MHDTVIPPEDAYRLLGLSGPVEPEVLTAAFREAVKAARPDFPGGDEDLFRRVIAAYGLIRSRQPERLCLPAPKSAIKARPILGLTPCQAVQGAVVTVRLGARRLAVRVPPGMRSGEHIRLKAVDHGDDLHLAVLIRPDQGLLALGDDLHMRWSVTPRLLEDGGRVEIQTHAGVRSAWVTPGLSGPVRLRLRDLGLPARGVRPAGHLFVTLSPSAAAPSVAEDMLSRFTRAWTPERLAA